MSEISDEFKTVVVEAIKSVCVKFPRKHHILMNFLATMLREEVSLYTCTCTCMTNLVYGLCGYCSWKMEIYMYVVRFTVVPLNNSKDMLQPAILFFVERLSALQGLKMN